MTIGARGLSASLAEVDPAVAGLIADELDRQQRVLDMVASENVVPRAVLEVQGSILTNKYADGYPGRRDYDGCEVVDKLEQLAIDRATALFGAEHANVQPYSGSSANAAVLHALCEPGDAVLGFDFAQGGHPTHHDRTTFAGRFYDAQAYGVGPDRWIDMDEVRAAACAVRPKVLFAGWSCYPRPLDFAAFRAIADEVGAYLVVDMAHFSGLVAARCYPDPVPYADACTFTVHKTLGGPRGGAILSRAAIAERIDAAVYPGEQGAPLMHVIAAKAVTFALCATDEFRERIARTIAGARIVAAAFNAAPDTGCDVVTGGTDVHLLLLDTSRSGRSAGALLDVLHAIGVTANAMRVARDERRVPDSSGLRLGTASLATRGFGAAEFTELADILVRALLGDDLAALKDATAGLARRFPITAIPPR